MSEKPACPQGAPYGVELQPGTYWWCACGYSQKQPFCDSNHKGRPFSPVRFVVEEPKRVWLCGCKQTGTPPFCDGTHKRLKQ